MVRPTTSVVLAWILVVACSSPYDSQEDPTPSPGSPRVCEAGRADCDGNEVNGCETDIASSHLSCGACGKTCDFAPNAYPVCQASTCVIGCNTGFFDCDGKRENGCEADVRADADHCGACGKPCGPSGAKVPTPGARCAAGVCTYPRSCAVLPPGTPPGVQRIDPDGDGPGAPFDAFCETVADGGGWTLLVKVDGAKPTFAYDAPAWTDPAPLQPDAPDLDGTEAKLAGYATMPVRAVRFGMRDGTKTTFLAFDAFAESLLTLFRGGSDVLGSVRTGFSQLQWRGLLAGASGQPFCNLQGVNAVAGSAPYVVKLRLGIIMNNEDDCLTPDSWIGIGAARDGLTSGNYAADGLGDNGPRATKTMGYLMIR